MKIENDEFYVLKGKTNHIFVKEEEAIEQIKKDKDTDVKLICVNVSEDEWNVATVGWNEIAKHLL
jgi:hypothetical protein